MKKLDYFSGQVRMEITCAIPEAALQEFNHRGVILCDVSKIDEMMFRFTISSKDKKLVREICSKRGYRLKIINQAGFFRTVCSMKHRSVLLVGMILLAMLAAYLPTQVFFIEVNGSKTVPEKEILSVAERNGMEFGVARRKIRSEKVKNALLSEIPQLKWAGVNSYGSMAEISVLEKEVEEDPESAVSGVCNVVALRDGTILSCTAENGNLLCTPGQAVKAGDVLISGYTDCGLCIQAVQAAGEIYAKTERNVCAVLPNAAVITEQGVRVENRYTLLVGKKRINLWIGSGIWDASCGRIYTKYALRLPGGFELPIILQKEQYQGNLFSKEEISQQGVRERLYEFAEKYLNAQMIAGQIKNREVVLTFTENCGILDGIYDCEEMIGAVQWEQDLLYEQDN